MSHELYKRYRPKKLSDLVGQSKAIASLRKFVEQKKLPHALLLAGPSGTGKTTIARILRRTLNCSGTDYTEINSSDFKGIDTVRELRRSAQLLPMAGDSRVYLIDECHKMTSDAQNAILKLLEDTPEHVYFILATTDPEKLLATILGRCTEVKLVRLDDKALESLLLSVIEKEKLKIDEDVIDKIIEGAEGSARKALVILEAVSKVEGEEAQKEAVMHSTLDKDAAHALAKILVFPRGEHWNDVAKLLRTLENYEAEGIRQVILGMARAAMIGSKAKGKPSSPLRGAIVAEIFDEPLFHSRHPGLALRCYQVHKMK